MRKTRIMPCLLAILVIFCFYGLAFSGGGGPDPLPICADLPAPDSGRFIRGEFTAARDKIGIGEDAHYNVHFILKFQNQTHLFSFVASLGSGNICAYTAEDLKDTFESVPCNMDIVGDFVGLTGVPVIASLTIKQTDFCTSEYDQMIRGEVLIRVVPTE